MSDGGERARRFRGFALHLAGYATVITLLLVLTVLFSPGETWILFPMVGWGAVLALHVAYVMGLFDVFRAPTRPPDDGEGPER